MGRYGNRFLIRETKTPPSKRTMNSDQDAPRSLREIEMEVMAEGREWMRQRLQQKLQQQADRHGGVFPPQRSPDAPPARKDDAFAHQRGRRRAPGVARPRPQR